MLQSNQKIIRHKVGLLNLAEELGNVSKACQMMGLSRDTFYRYRDAVEDGGVEALLERSLRTTMAMVITGFAIVVAAVFVQANAVGVGCPRQECEADGI